MRRFSFPTKQALTGISNHVDMRNVQQCQMSFASVSSEKPVKKTGKRLPIYERKAMVKSFIENYRAMNLGKFPTISIAQKEVGGSYYSIRKIFQELEFESKMSSINMGSVGEELAKMNAPLAEGEDVKIVQIATESPSGAEEVSSSQIVIESSIGMDNFDFIKHFDLESSAKSTSMENVNSEEKSEPSNEDEAVLSSLISIVPSPGTEEVLSRQIIIESSSGMDNFDSIEHFELKNSAKSTFLENVNSEKSEPSKEDEDVISSQINIGSSPGTEEVLRSQMTIKAPSGLDRYDSNKHFEMMESLKSSSMDNVISKEVTDTREKDDNTNYHRSQTHLGTAHEAEQHEDAVMKNAKRSSSEEQADAELTKKTSMWGNLKSLANGFFNIWKKF